MLISTDFVSTCRTSFDKRVIDEHDTVSHENVVANGDQFTDESVTLHFNVVANDYTFLDFWWPNKATFSEITAVKVDRFNNCQVAFCGDSCDLRSVTYE